MEDQVNEIIGGNDGENWVGTQESGMFRYRSNGLLEAIKLDSGKRSIKALHQDRKGDLWVGCWPQPCGLLHFNPESGMKEVLRHDPDDSNSHSSDLIMDILEDRSGRIWIATWGGGVNRYDPVAGVFTRYSNGPNDTTSLGGDFVTCLYEDSSGAIWVGGGGALLEPSQPAFLDRFLPANEVFEHHFSGMEVEAFSSFYDHNENVIWGNGLTYSFKGWKEVEKQIRPVMEQAPNPLEPSEFYNYQISVAGNQAWATFDKKNKGSNRPVSKEQRVLVKKDGEWKLIVMLFFTL